MPLPGFVVRGVFPRFWLTPPGDFRGSLREGDGAFARFLGPFDCESFMLGSPSVVVFRLRLRDRPRQ